MSDPSTLERSRHFAAPWNLVAMRRHADIEQAATIKLDLCASPR